MLLSFNWLIECQQTKEFFHSSLLHSFYLYLNRCSCFCSKPEGQDNAVVIALKKATWKNFGLLRPKDSFPYWGFPRDIIFLSQPAVIHPHKFIHFDSFCISRIGSNLSLGYLRRTSGPKGLLSELAVGQPRFCTPRTELSLRSVGPRSDS